MEETTDTDIWLGEIPPPLKYQKKPMRELEHVNKMAKRSEYLWGCQSEIPEWDIGVYLFWVRGLVCSPKQCTDSRSLNSSSSKSRLRFPLEQYYYNTTMSPSSKINEILTRWKWGYQRKTNWVSAEKWGRPAAVASLSLSVLINRGAGVYLHATLHNLGN